MTKRVRLALVLIVCSLIPSGALALAARDYSRTFMEHRAELLECAGGAEGTVVIQAQFDPEGRLAWERVTRPSSEAMRNAGRCVLDRARGWRFDRSTSGGWRSYELAYAGGGVSIRVTHDRIPTPQPPHRRGN